MALLYTKKGQMGWQRGASPVNYLAPNVHGPNVFTGHSEMHQVVPQDNFFFHMESAATPMHVGLLCIYNQSTTTAGKVRFKDIIQTFAERLHKVPPLRHRVVSTPLKLDYPYWIVDPDFDIEFHMRHIALPAPGDWRQLCILVARLNARPLDMGRPLWEATVIEGLDNIAGLPEGCFAIHAKIHLSVFNRELGGQVMAALHELEPNSPTSKEERHTLVDRIPTDAELLSRAAINRVKIIGSYIDVARRHAVPTLCKLLDAARHKRRCSLLKAPSTLFNKRVSPHRVIENVSVSMERVQAIRNSCQGARFNDVVIAIIAGGMRRYLLKKGALPCQSLTAMFPIALPPKDASQNRIHRFSHIFPRLFTDIEDDWQRLVKLVPHMAQARHTLVQLDWQLTDDIARLFPNTLADLLLKSVVNYQIARGSGVFFNTLISSVPGPHIPLYLGGARLEACYGLDPIYNNVGLSHNVFSYNETLNITINACRCMMPDPDFYAECLQEACTALQNVANSSATGQ